MPRTTRSFSYPKRVRFQCTRCTLCCGDTEKRTRHILLLGDEAKEISEAISKPVEAFALPVRGREPYTYEIRKTSQAACPFLEAATCQIYPHRPLVCRFYPLRLAADKNGKHRFHFTRECPGIDRGAPLEESYFQSLFNRAVASSPNAQSNKSERAPKS